MPLNILIFGAPGSGKGSISELLVREYGLVHISVGGMLREEVRKKTPLGLHVASRMDEGLLITDEIVVNVLKPHLRNPEVVKRGVLLDGFPRTIDQAKALTAIGFEIDVLLFIKVDARVVEERCVLRRLDPVTGHIYNLKSDPPPKDIAHRVVTRSDDTHEKHHRRMKIFSEQADALLKFYKAKVLEIDGNPSLDDVYKSTKIGLEKLIAKKRITSKI